MASKLENPVKAMLGNNKLHIAMFPWLAFGHIIPFLDYSKFLAEKGHKITFISTPRNIDRLPKIPPSLLDSITFLKLSLPQTDGLPPNAEATMDVHTDDVPFLKKAYDGLEPELSRFLEKSVPDLIMYDFSPYWLPEIAARLGISRVFFSIFNAWFFAFFGPTDFMINGTDPRKKAEEFMVPPKWVPFENKVAYRLFEVTWFRSSGKENVSGVSDTYRAGKVISGSEAMFIRHSPEFQGEWLDLLEELYRKPVIPLGLMPPATDNDESNETWVSIKTWLESQNKGSVVYVALGSEVVLTQTQLSELALGLELSGVPFFWVFRKPAWSKEAVELPEGYEERVKGRGLVWKRWVPQLKILSHDSVGGFLTHCGWSSNIEGLMLGHPLIMLPFLVDQGLNARVMEDIKVGVEVPRDEEDGSYTKESLADTVKLIMVESDGEIYRTKAKEISRIFADKELHKKYLESAI